MHPADVVAPGAAFADDPGPVLASGAFADVHALDDDRVLRRYRHGRDAVPEADLIRHVRAHGFPAPDVIDASGSDILMRRLHGPTLLQALGAGEVSVADGARVLADLHALLHRIPAPEQWREAPDHDWPHLGGPVVVHLDLHPGNVILTEDGPALVDWANARAGSPELDVALTSVLVAEVAADGDGDYSLAARALLAAFLHASDVSPAVALDDAAALRSVSPSLAPGERELLPRATALIRTMLELMSHD